MKGLWLWMFLTLLHACGFCSVSASGDKWEKLKANISAAVREYVPCNSSDCSCYLGDIQRDLQPFRKDKISEDLVAAARKAMLVNHYQIIEHKLYRQPQCVYPGKCRGVELFILDIIDRLPDMDLVVNIMDMPTAPKSKGPALPIFSFSKTDDYHDIMYPAWIFWVVSPAMAARNPAGLSRWDLEKEDILKAAALWPWEKKMPIGFFRGSRTSKERDPLILRSREHPDLMDAKYTKHELWRSNKDSLGPPADEVSRPDHCKYKYLFNLRGVAASFRFKHLFLCGSLVFHVGDEWQEFFYSQLKPWIHYVPVRADLSNIVQRLRFVRENDAIAKEIARRGQEFILNHLRMDDLSCYWEKLLTEYSSLLTYKPKRNEKCQPVPLRAKDAKTEL